MSVLTRLSGSAVSAAFRLAVIALAIYGGLDLTRSVLAQEEHRAYVPYTQQPGTLEERVAALESKLQHVVASSDAITITDANLWVVNGTGSTDGVPNGLGNVIAGYNELRTGSGERNIRTGSHMLIVGKEHNYSRFGGVVVGWRNEVSGDYSAVCGGANNEARELGAAVTGGRFNSAGGRYSMISGGNANTTEGDDASVSGGTRNCAFAQYSSVLGGESNQAQGESSTVGGGIHNSTLGPHTSVHGGDSNQAQGRAASVGGGHACSAEGEASFIGGGTSNFVSGVASYGSIVGGFDNRALGWASSVSGGEGNTASGESSSVSGGQNRTAPGDYNWAAGSLLEER